MLNIGNIQDKYICNLKKDVDDDRDYIYIPKFTKAKLPWRVDFRKLYKLIDSPNQENIITSVTGAISFSYYFDQITEKKSEFVPSCLFMYYNTINNTAGDINISIRDIFKNINTVGVCNEKIWSSTIKQTIKPHKTAYAEALKYKDIVYNRVSQTLNDIKTALANNFVVIFGMMLYSSFMSEYIPTNGNMVNPNTAFETLIGCNVFALIGYDEYRPMSDGTRGAFIVRNNCGKKWGESGYFYAPYSVITNSELCFDFWIMTKRTIPISSKMHLLTYKDFNDTKKLLNNEITDTPFANITNKNKKIKLSQEKEKEITTVSIQINKSLLYSKPLIVPVEVPFKNGEKETKQLLNIEVTFVNNKETEQPTNNKKKIFKPVAKTIGFKIKEKLGSKNNEKHIVKRDIIIRKKQSILHLV